MVENKTVVIVNGSGGVGKDTLVDNYIKEKGHAAKYSSITPIKEVAAMLGWEGSKSDKDRKFLSDLKCLSTEYNNYPFLYLKDMFTSFRFDSELDHMFVMIREPKEIDKFKKFCLSRYIKCITVLIKRDGYDKIYGNTSDDDVDDYHYDLVFFNDGSIEERSKLFIHAIRCAEQAFLDEMK